MKKLATVIAAVASLAIASPVFACPNMDHGDSAAPRTADKDKKDAPKDTKGGDTTTAKAKDEPKPAETGKKTDTTKKADTAKKPDKVSQR